MEPSSRSNFSSGFLAKLVLLSWFSMLGFDFFWHAGLLSSLYSQPSPFLLPLERAFALIPLGYLSILLFDLLLLWLMLRLQLQGWKQGALFGLQVGILAWGAFAIGLFSIAAVPPGLLIAMFFGQAIELGIAGGVIGFGLARSRLRRLLVAVLIFVILALVMGIILQNIGLF